MGSGYAESACNYAEQKRKTRTSGAKATCRAILSGLQCFSVRPAEPPPPPHSSALQSSIMHSDKRMKIEEEKTSIIYPAKHVSTSKRTTTSALAGVRAIASRGDCTKPEAHTLEVIECVHIHNDIYVLIICVALCNRTQSRQHSLARFSLRTHANGSRPLRREQNRTPNAEMVKRRAHSAHSSRLSWLGLREE